MGIYQIKCSRGGETFEWFSGRADRAGTAIAT